jgi:hypothetical protein
MILRLLNPQGIAGLAAALCFAALLILQKGETRHWRKETGHFEQLYRAEQAAFAGTVANYRVAADAARAADKAAAERVRSEQAAISERTKNAFEIRLADTRARAERLRLEAAKNAIDSRGGGAAPLSGLPAPAGDAAQSTGQDRLSDSDRLIATEQAIQLDELIKWVKAQAAVKRD